MLYNINLLLTYFMCSSLYIWKSSFHLSPSSLPPPLIFFYICESYSVFLYTWRNFKVTEINEKLYCALGLKNNIVKIAILAKTIYRFTAILLKYPEHFFTELKQITLKFKWNHKWSWIAKATLRKKNKSEVWPSQTSDYIQRYSHQNSMVAAQKQTHRSGE